MFFSLLCRAQQVHFIYLQSENKQPFYVRVNAKLFSSSAAGYLVVPKLTPGDYSLTVGFPRNEWPVQTIDVKVKNEDLGYLLKNFGEKGWGLFNLQTMQVINATQAAGTQSTTAVRNDAFSTVLADVVNTPSIKELPPENKPPQQISKPEIAKADVAVTLKAPETSPAKPYIRLLSSQSVGNGNETERLYIDYSGKTPDTIQVLLAAGIVQAPEQNEVISPVAEEPVRPVSDNLNNNKEQANDAEPKFLDIQVPANAGESTKRDDAAQHNKQPGLQMINSDCKKLADDEDFLQIRKKIAAERTDERMVAAAAKSFRQKCFSTAQVKNLSVLFLSDEGKYKFFDAAYPHVHDTANFPALEAELTDTYFISRFKAMIR